MSLPESGTVCVLTTFALDGSLHSRPVTVWRGCCSTDLLVLTEFDAAKLTEIERNPPVSLAGPAADGWWSAEGTAMPDPDGTPDALRAAGLSLRLPVTVVRVSLARLRIWTVTGEGPWDNTYAEQTFAVDAP